MRDFAFAEPTRLREAIQALDANRDQCRLLAGGTALLLALRQRMVAPALLISLARLRELRGVTFDSRLGVRIGAFTTHTELARSQVVRQFAPMLADIAGRLANPQVRNQGTIAGNICYADPATDPPTCLIAMDAQIVVHGLDGERIIPAEQFCTDYYTTSLGPNEIVTEIRVPPPMYTVGRHYRFRRTAAEHRPLLNLALAIRLENDRCEDIRIVIGASTPTPTRVRSAEAFLKGKLLSLDVASEAAAIAASQIDPISDFRGDAEYRRAMVRVVSRRALCALGGLEPSNGDKALE